MASWCLPCCLLMLGVSRERSWLKLDVHDEEIVSICKEGYIGVNSKLCLEWNKPCWIILINLGNEKEIFTRKTKMFWRKLDPKYLVFSSSLPIPLPWVHFHRSVYQPPLETWFSGSQHQWNCWRIWTTSSRKDGITGWKICHLLDVWLLFIINSLIYSSIIHSLGGFKPSFSCRSFLLLVVQE